MSTVFADTYYFLGLLYRTDRAHAKCLEFAHNWRGTFLTTTAVLLELADGMSEPLDRVRAEEFIRDLSRDPRVKITALAPDLFDRGLAFYAQHSDKDWSLTDCISFVVMREEGIREAATGDHDFEQAGFTILLK